MISLLALPFDRWRLPGALLLSSGLFFSVSLSSAAETARFAVHDRSVTRDLIPFTATITDIGNGRRLSGESGFEPRVFRSLFMATEDSQNRIIAPDSEISQYDSWATGAFDGADVEVFRIENGVFRSVRRDRVAAGGFQASGWLPLNGRNEVLPADRTSFVFSPDMWNRTGATWYFTVRAVNWRGRLSEPAQAVPIVLAPEPRDKTSPEPENGLIKMELSDRAASRLSAPEGLRARQIPNRRIELAWDPVPGASGYVLYRSDIPPEEHKGHYIELEGTGPAIRSGDMVILRDKFLRLDRARLVTHRMWDAFGSRRSFALPRVPGWSDAEQEGGWHLIPHDPGTAVEDPGETYLRVDLEEGEDLFLGGYNHAGPDQTWYEVLQPGKVYRMDVWLRGRSSQPVQFTLTGFYGRGREPMVAPFTIAPTPEWTKYTTTFTVPRVLEGREVGQMLLKLTGPGQIDIDNFRIYRDDAPFLGLLPEDVTRLEDSGMGALRTHAFIRTKQATYDLSQLTNPAGAANTPGGNTLPQTLAIIDQVGMEPWLQIEPHFSREEWLGLAEYLAAPFDPDSQDAAALPWAAKRVSQGHAQPWTDRFDRILFEVGNETWNRLFAPWTFPTMQDGVTGEEYSRGTVYGLYQEYVLSILRDSPYWPQLADKLVPVLGGWAISNYGVEAAAASPHSQILTHAAYIGGWDAGEGPVSPTPQGFSSVLTYAPQTGISNAEGFSNAAARLSEDRAVPLLTGTYEGGPGYAMNGLNNEKVTSEQAEQQEEVMKSAAAGTATLDTFLGRARAGEQIQNFFTYGCGARWTSHACWQDGGQTYPSWDLLALVNREGLGEMLDVEGLAVPTANLPELRRRKAVENAPMVAVYATRKDRRLTVFVVSRKVPGYLGEGDGMTSVSIDLPFSKAAALTWHRLSGTYESNNLLSKDASLVSTALPVPENPSRLEIPDLPPGEAYVYVFDGIEG